MKRKSINLLLFILALTVIARIAFVSADPTSPQQIEAQAGNLTELTIQALSGAQPSWQGYYGNISGTLTLANAQNSVMYSWEGEVNPVGEVYAANESVTNWDKIICMNLSSSHKGFNCTGQNEQCVNITEIENYYDMSPTDIDGVNETFNRTIANITIGTVELSGCPMTTLYVNNTPSPVDYWNETMLTINNTDTIIYASITNPDTFGFNNKTWDFQMIVRKRK